MKKYGLPFLLTLVAQLGAFSLQQIATNNIQLSANTVAWLQSEDGNFLAAGSTQNALRVFQFDADSGNLEVRVNFRINSLVGDPINSVAWTQSDDGTFLASGGDERMLEIFKFDNNATQFNRFDRIVNENIGIAINSVDWLQTAGGTFLAVGLADGTIQIFSFDGNQITLVDTETFISGGTTETVTWIRLQDGDFLAAGGQSTAITGAEVAVYSFDVTNTADELTEVSRESGLGGQRTLFDIAWLETGGVPYLAVVVLAQSGQVNASRLEVYSFDAQSGLAFVDDEGGIGSRGAVDWVSSDGNLLALGGVETSSQFPRPGRLEVFSFDGNNLENEALLDNLSSEVTSVGWLHEPNPGTFLATGRLNSTDPNIIVYELCGTPVANDLEVQIRLNISTVINVLANDQVACASLQSALITEPTNGTAVVNSAEGTVTYTPNEGFEGTDSFTYQICDAESCAQATVTIEVTGLDDELARQIQEKYSPFCSLLN